MLGSRLAVRAGFGFAVLASLACGGAGTPEPAVEAGKPADGSVTPAADAAASASVDVRTHEFAPRDGQDPSMLAGLDAMNLESSMEIDGFRAWLDYPWGDVHKILRTAGAEFKKDGENFLVMTGEMPQGGFPWRAVIVVDLVQKKVFAAQFDGENKRVDQFQEENEGLTTPELLTRWVKEQSAK